LRRFHYRQHEGYDMKGFTKLGMIFAAFALAACDSDSNNNRVPPPPAAAFFDVQVLHASPDAPAVNVLVDGAVALSDVDYKTGSGHVTLPAGLHTVQVDGILPGGNAAVIGPVDITFAGYDLYDCGRQHGGEHRTRRHPATGHCS